jgi:hypothetical protein
VDKKLKQLLGLGVVLLVVGGSMAIAASRLATRANSPGTRPIENDTRTNHPVVIRKPLRTPVVFTGVTNLHGQPVAVACSTCHTTTKANPQISRSEDLDEFHQGLKFAHGAVSCLSCHNEKNYDALHLANGMSLAYENVMNLCAQCHGPQFRDYRNGSHGGMNGYWDLKAGGRTRNNCVDCHDPHAPAYVPVMPVFKPLPGERHAKPSQKQHH